MEFSPEDIKQFERKGISKNTIENQIRHFINGFPFLNLMGSAIPGDGIIKYSEDKEDQFISHYEDKCNDHEMIKFVPASGAATRMVQHLFEFIENDTKTDQEMLEFSTDKSFNSVYYFLHNLKDFAFYTDLEKIIKDNGTSLKSLLSEKKYSEIIVWLLTEKGLNYSNLPKGLLKFHKYKDHSRLAIEEHLVESAFYCRNSDDTVSIHFTVSPEHLEDFKNRVGKVKAKYEKEFGVRYIIDYSIQKSSTDTIAVDIKNKPFRNEDGRIVFRPGGHGALIVNLKEIRGDIIFIKNIDNIVPDSFKPATYRYKKLLAGILFAVQEKIFDHLKKIDKGLFKENDIESIKKFMEDELFIGFPEDFDDLELVKQFEWMERKLNRPIRVCGIVKNEGEPGGGPFWVYNDNGEKTLQIVEKSQVDREDPDQNKILESSTHFNPVDLVCGVRDYLGNSFNLKNFIDTNTGLISLKSKDGTSLKALESPGLWNGAMANWTTIFVEVPIITFNPVKIINDLLREQHLVL